MAVTTYAFTYPNRAAFIAAGWDFLARTAGGSNRDTEDAGRLTYNSGGGLLCTLTDGEIWDGSNDAVNMIFRDLPEGWTSVTARMNFSPQTQPWRQAGVVVYQDDDNYVGGIRGYTGEWGVFWEANGTPNEDYTWGTSAVNPFWLRVDKSGDVYTFLLSTDGTSWTTMRTVTQALTAPRLALYSASPGGTGGTCLWLEATVDAPDAGAPEGDAGTSYGYGPAAATGTRASTGAATTTFALGGAAASGARGSVGSAATSLTFGPGDATGEAPAVGVAEGGFAGTYGYGPAGADGDAPPIPVPDGHAQSSYGYGDADAVGATPAAGGAETSYAFGPAGATGDGGAAGSFSTTYGWGAPTSEGKTKQAGSFTTGYTLGPATAVGAGASSGSFATLYGFGAAEAAGESPEPHVAAGGFTVACHWGSAVTAGYSLPHGHVSTSLTFAPASAAGPASRVAPDVRTLTLTTPARVLDVTTPQRELTVDTPHRTLEWSTP